MNNPRENFQRWIAFACGFSVATTVILLENAVSSKQTLQVAAEATAKGGNRSLLRFQCGLIEVASSRTSGVEVLPDRDAFHMMFGDRNLQECIVQCFNCVIRKLRKSQIYSLLIVPIVDGISPFKHTDNILRRCTLSFWSIGNNADVHGDHKDNVYRLYCLIFLLPPWSSSLSSFSRLDILTVGTATTTTTTTTTMAIYSASRLFTRRSSSPSSSFHLPSRNTSTTNTAETSKTTTTMSTPSCFCTCRSSTPRSSYSNFVMTGTTTTRSTNHDRDDANGHLPFVHVSSSLARWRQPKRSRRRYSCQVFALVDLPCEWWIGQQSIELHKENVLRSAGWRKNSSTYGSKLVYGEFG